MTHPLVPRSALIALLAVATATTRMSAQDTSFAGMQGRGKVVMSVDQYASVHHFDDLADGGRIQLQSDKPDSTAIHAIRAHLHGISNAFANGDFSMPAFVHMKQVPGTSTMVAKRAAITYSMRELPNGGELRMVTADPSARKAIHAFLAFQRGEHHAAGRDMHDGMQNPAHP